MTTLVGFLAITITLIAFGTAVTGGSALVPVILLVLLLLAGLGWSLTT